MSTYRTEIVVPLDRCIHIYVPDDFPIGVARLVLEPLPAAAAAHAEASTAVEPEGRAAPAFLERRVIPGPDLDQERQDVEWWEEFEDGDGDGDEAGGEEDRPLFEAEGGPL